MLQLDFLSLDLVKEIDNFSYDELKKICQQIVEEEGGEWIPASCLNSKGTLRKMIKTTLRLNAPRSSSDKQMLLDHWRFKARI